MRTCKTCKFWEHYNLPQMVETDINKDGFCKNENLTENDLGIKFTKVKFIYFYSEGGRFWTGLDFGCVHHKKE